MPIYFRIFYLFLLICFSNAAYAVRIRDRIDIIGYGGYDQVSGVAIANSTTDYGTLKGYDGGAALLLTLSRRRFSPVIGGGAHYSMIKNSVSSGTSSKEYELTSLTGTGHLGFRLVGPFVKFFILGNGGYSTSDTFKSSTISAAGKTTSSSTDTLNNHTFYGGTLSLLITAAPFIKVGVNGIYNVHSADLVDAAGKSSAMSYNEVSANVAIDINI